jgi:hypothetical protein
MNERPSHKRGTHGANRTRRYVQEVTFRDVTMMLPMAFRDRGHCSLTTLCLGRDYLAAQWQAFEIRRI